MARKPSETLTEGELRVMTALWNKERGTVSELAEAIVTDPPLAYNTILTTLRILENKGFVRHKKQSRAFVYEPVIGREEATRGAVQQLLARFFNNSPDLLVANLIRHEKFRKRDLERLRKLIAQ